MLNDENWAEFASGAGPSRPNRAAQPRAGPQRNGDGAPPALPGWNPIPSSPGALGSLMAKHFDDTVVPSDAVQPVPFLPQDQAGGSGEGRSVPPSPLKALLKQHFGGNKTTGSPHGKGAVPVWGGGNAAPMQGWNQSSAASPRARPGR